jgi:ribonuclease BN (tRNA processing enzyme)
MVGGVAFGTNDSYLFFCGEGAQQQFWAAGLHVSLQKYFDDKIVKEIF